MAGAGFQDVKTYIFYIQNTVAQYILTRPIMDLFLEANQRTGPRVSMWWWEQESPDLEGIWNLVS